MPRRQEKESEREVPEMQTGINGMPSVSVTDPAALNVCSRAKEQCVGAAFMTYCLGNLSCLPEILLTG